MLNITIGDLSDNKIYGKSDSYIHPYMRNNFKGTPEIRETFERISKRHEVKSY